MSVQAISGPAGADNEDVGPFEWNEKWSDYSHVDLPKKWDFDWVEFTPSSEIAVEISDSCAA